jgi:hypothetical protein
MNSEAVLSDIGSRIDEDLRSCSVLKSKVKTRVDKTNHVGETINGLLVG